MPPKDQSETKTFTIICTNPEIANSLESFFPAAIKTNSAEEATKTVIDNLTKNAASIAIIFAFIPELKDKFIKQLRVLDHNSMAKDFLERVKEAETKATEDIKNLDTSKAEEIVEQAKNFNAELSNLYRRTEMTARTRDTIYKHIELLASIGTTLLGLKRNK